MSFFNEFQNIAGNVPISRRRALTGLSLLALTACSRSASQTTPGDSNIAYYTCTMHPFVRSHDPKAKCPVCGMNLVSVPKSLAPPGLSAGLAATDGGMAYIAPERLEEIGATTEVVAKRPWTHPTGERLGISSRAVLPTGNVFIVFVDHGGGQVEPREIRVGTSSGGYYEVISGLKDGDRVFNSANFLIDAECRIQGVLKTWGDPS